MRRTGFKTKEPKPKACKACRKKFIPDRPLQVVCSPGCAITLTRHAPEEVEKIDQQHAKVWKDEVKEKHKDHGFYQKVLQDEINHIVRLIDKGHVCISHGKPPQKKNAGHYHSVNANDPLRYHLENIWLQCESCNGYKGSNRTGYDNGLRDTFGQEYWLYINQELPLMYKTNKMSVPELKDAIRATRRIIKELILADRYYTNEERVSERKRINALIGIYATSVESGE